MLLVPKDNINYVKQNEERFRAEVNFTISDTGIRLRLSLY